MNKARSPLRVTVLLVVAMLILGACAGSAPQDSASLLFGVGAPLTGEDAQYGYWLQRGIELAAREINNSGGVNGREIKFEYGDDRCNAVDAAFVAQRFASNPDIVAIIGHVCSSATLATGTIYEKAGLTHITPGSTNPAVTTQGWARQFRTTPHDGLQGPQMARLAIERLGKSRLGILYGTEDYAVGLLESMRPAIDELHGEITALETFTPGDKDFSPQLTKIAEAGPDVLIFLGHYAEGGLVAQQRIGAGLGDIPFLCPDGCQQPGFIDLGGQGAEGALMLVYYDYTDPNPDNQRFVQAYREAYANETPVDQGPYGYWLVYLLKQAFEQGATRESLPDVLHKVEFMNATGLSRFDSTGDLDAGALQMPVVTVKSGEFVAWTP